MNNSYNEYFKTAKKMNVKNTKKIKESSNSEVHSQNDGRVKNLSKSKIPNKKISLSSRKKRHPSSIVPLLLFATGVSLTGWGYLNIESVLHFVERIEISPVAISAAVEKSEEKKSTDKNENKEKVASTQSGLEDNKSSVSEYNSAENINHYNKLNDRKTELDLREKELNELESELHEQRKDIEARIKKLEDIRSQIGQVLKDKVEVDEERVKKLVEFYSNMKPQNAAQIIATLNEDLAVEILGRMKKKNAADILNLLKPEKAQVLTEKFAGYKRR